MFGLVQDSQLHTKINVKSMSRSLQFINQPYCSVIHMTTYSSLFYKPMYTQYLYNAIIFDLLQKHPECIMHFTFRIPCKSEIYVSVLRTLYSPIKRLKLRYYCFTPSRLIVVESANTICLWSRQLPARCKYRFEQL